MAQLVTGICWGVVIAVWIVGALVAARGPRGRRRGSDVGTAWRFAAVVAAGVVYRLAQHDLRQVEDHSWAIELPGLVLLLASTGFTLWARLSLGRMWSASPNVLQAHHELRTDGPYAVTRHPIYTGLLGMLLGSVLLNGLGVSLAFLVFGVAFVAARIPIEERLMTATFPDEYPRYRRRVPRVTPGRSCSAARTEPTITDVDEFVSTFVRADLDAREFIRSKGGEVYAWAGPDGFMKVGFRRPEDVDFVELRCDGFTLFQDATIRTPSPQLGWHVWLRRWPRRRIKIEYAASDSGIDVLEVLSRSPWP